jgi:hypothetical protein
VNVFSSRAYLTGELARLRIDIELRTLAGERSKALQADAMLFLQTALQLKAMTEARLQ